MNIKVFIILFVSNTIHDFGINHNHVLALHEIGHDILESGHVCFETNEEIIDVIFCSNIKSLIAMSIIELTENLESMIVVPILFFGDIIHFEFEEENLIWWADNKCIFINHKHLT